MAEPEKNKRALELKGASATADDDERRAARGGGGIRGTSVGRSACRTAISSLQQAGQIGRLVLRPTCTRGSPKAAARVTASRVSSGNSRAERAAGCGSPSALDRAR